MDRVNYELEFQSLLASPPKTETKKPAKELMGEIHLQQVYTTEEAAVSPREEARLTRQEPISEARLPIQTDPRKVEQTARQPEHTQLAETDPPAPFRGETRSSPRAITREVELPIQEGVKLGPRQYSTDKIERQEEPTLEELRVSARPLSNQVQQFGARAREDVKASPRQSPNRYPLQQAATPAHENTKASPRQLPFQHTESPTREEPRASPRQSLNPFQQPQIVARQEPKIIPRPYSNSFQQSETPAREESRASPRQYSNPFQQPETSAQEDVKSSPGQHWRVSPQFETPPREVSKASPRQYPNPFPSAQPEVPAQEKPTAVTRQDSKESERLEAPVPRNFVSFEVKEPTTDISRTSSRDSSVQEIRALTKEALQRSAEELRKEDMKPVRSREEVKPLAERTPSRTPPTLYPQTHAIKPQVVDIHVTPINSTERKIEEVVLPAKDELKSNRVLVTTDSDDTWAPPKNIRMKKSKKTFSTRY
jgi:hypothetical protein